MHSAALTCLPCPSHCRTCHAAGGLPGGCDSCFMFYSLSDGRCTLSMAAIVLSVLLVALCSIPIMLGLRAACCYQCCVGRRIADVDTRQNLLEVPPARAPAFTMPPALAPAPASAPLTPPAHAGTASAPSAAQALSDTPSGLWSGYYACNGRNHALCTFQLRFAENGEVTGEGVDDVGTYWIRGQRVQQTVSFAKTYRLGSRNDRGIVPTGVNEGHTVQYHGTFVGRDLGAGFRGAWSLRNRGTNNDDVFHLWPAMENLSVHTGMLAEPGDAEQPHFEVAEDNECVVCFENAIDTCLVPCGHIAVCSQCADRIVREQRNQPCPICRTSITSVVRAQSQQALRGA